MSNRYNRKIAALCATVGVLALVYAGLVVFDSEKARGPSFSWLETKWADQADRIEIAGDGGSVTLVRKNGLWFVSRDAAEYPAKQARVQDFLSILTAKGRYAVRGTEASSHERLGLTEDAASRVTVRAGVAPYPVLDLLVGNRDSTGKEVYLRKSGAAEVRSGEDRISDYADSRPEAWLNLRLFPEADYLKSEAVQRLRIERPAVEGQPRSVLSLSRRDGGWTAESLSATDSGQVESYLNALLAAEGEDFLPEAPDTLQAEGRIILEPGNGQEVILFVGGLSESKRRSAWITGGAFTYSLAEWTLSRLFRDDSYFARP
ncbi:MAG: DUF4340 domain-containing protein [Spirochaetaceae bacterium]|nr:DUF4340 domain-containing protein [Spirochaetaceae bacterium]